MKKSKKELAQEVQTISGKAKMWKDRYTNMTHWIITFAVIIIVESILLYYKW